MLKFLFNYKLWFVVTLFNLCACASKPTLVPFSAEKAGSVTSQTLHVTRESGWEAQLVFLVIKGTDREIFDRLQNTIDNISGGLSTPLKPHRGVKLRLTIVKNINGQQSLLIREKLIAEEPLGGAAPGGASVHLDGFRLLPGEYVVSIETLEDNPRLAGINVALFVGTTWK